MNSIDIEEIEGSIMMEYKGMRGYLRKSVAGIWCGYVELPKDHPILIDKQYKDLDVHGGITWDKDKLPWQMDHSADFFYVGFDCGHLGDIIPSESKLFSMLNLMMEKNHGIEATYKDFEFAKNELEGLIDDINLMESEIMKPI